MAVPETKILLLPLFSWVQHSNTEGDTARFREKSWFRLSFSTLEKQTKCYGLHRKHYL